MPQAGWRVRVSVCFSQRWRLGSPGQGASLGEFCGEDPLPGAESALLAASSPRHDVLGKKNHDKYAFSDVEGPGPVSLEGREVNELCTGLKSFLSYAGCKFVFSLHRVGRGISLSTTCLLSGFQAVKLCLSFSGWMELRMRSTVFIGFCCSICWILHLLLNMVVTMNVTGPKNSKNMSVENIYRNCLSPIPERLVFCISAVIYTSTDGVCLGLMVWTSGPMVLVLHRHKQQDHHIHRNRLSPRPAHEARATCPILILVSMFVSLHSPAAVL
ncbi:vomeronasal type-1 receptor 1-like [Equus quagga]|uniref:vomeronasal type-1 receptor 1-like n=1 Tax=Equus quagga TaxID=89248 RepID=UPI001EE1E877|nr:vomeronasal type-1 receptor 1-like [Equus quagga]